MSNRTPVAIGLGSNLGDRAAYLAAARDGLAALLDAFRMSSVIETEPVDVPGDQPRFLNAVAIGTTTLTARDLLGALLAIEQESGRERPSARSARTLDLDLLFFGDAVIDEPGLRVPHPRLRDRRFVLEPLAEVAPDIRDPVTGLTATALLARLPPAR